MKDNPFIADALNLFNSGVGFMADLQKQILQDLKERMNEKIDQMDLAKREDVDRLEKRIQALEAEIALLRVGKAPAKAAAPKPAAKKPAAKKTAKKTTAKKSTKKA